VSVREDRSILSRPAPAPDDVVRYGPAPAEVADVRSGGTAARARPLLVIVHGGFWRPAFDRTHVQPMATVLAEAGWTTVVPEYRRAPGDPDASVGDVHAAVRSLPRSTAVTGLSDGRVLLVGHSAGGHLALQAAAADGIQDLVHGVLALAPVADLRLAEALALDGDAVRAFLGGPAARRPDLDPARQADPACRVHLLHGADDAVVPPELSEAYLAAHPGAAFSTVASGHFALIDPRTDVWPEVPAVLTDLGS
jgi:acetyl esterase/lipase